MLGVRLPDHGVCAMWLALDRSDGFSSREWSIELETTLAHADVLIHGQQTRLGLARLCSCGLQLQVRSQIIDQDWVVFMQFYLTSYPSRPGRLLGPLLQDNVERRQSMALRYLMHTRALRSRYNGSSV